ncbi:MAG: hypothetical protein ACRDS1_17600, partial [Pseudonocardiaceae bacterium]
TASIRGTPPPNSRVEIGVTTTRSAVAEFGTRAVRSCLRSPGVELGARRAVPRGSSPHFTHQGGA